MGQGSGWAVRRAGRHPAAFSIATFLPNALWCRMAINHSRLLQGFAASAPAACGALTSAQTVALQLQAAAAASFALAVMQLCLAAQQPGSLLYRLASNATLALFTGGAINTQRFLLLTHQLASALRRLSASACWHAQPSCSTHSWAASLPHSARRQMGSSCCSYTAAQSAQRLRRPSGWPLLPTACVLPAS